MLIAILRHSLFPLAETRCYYDKQVSISTNGQVATYTNSWVTIRSNFTNIDDLLFYKSYKPPVSIIRFYLSSITTCISERVHFHERQAENPYETSARSTPESVRGRSVWRAKAFRFARTRETTT
jgi:hypothetical protein